MTRARREKDESTGRRARERANERENERERVRELERKSALSIQTKTATTTITTAARGRGGSVVSNLLPDSASSLPPPAKFPPPCLPPRPSPSPFPPLSLTLCLFLLYLLRSPVLFPGTSLRVSLALSLNSPFPPFVARCFRTAEVHFGARIPARTDRRISRGPMFPV